MIYVEPLSVVGCFKWNVHVYIC